MTVTTLAEIAACPRRWALSAGDYPDIWSGIGYPPRIHFASLGGSVVHLVLERITKLLVRRGCTSASHPGATAVLREIGGYSKLVHDCIDTVLERLRGNPRAVPILEATERKLRAQAADFRMRAQQILSRLRLPRAGAELDDIQGDKRRGRLSNGTYSELLLRAPDIGWKGKVDLLVLTETTCELVDFKTGAFDESHRQQLLTYAVLWNHDKVLNPDGRVATRLILSYPGSDHAFAAPTAEEMEQLENQLVRNRESAHLALAHRPPEARPSAQNCRFCDVRHMCDEYWLPSTQRAIWASSQQQSFVDAEITVTSKHGPSSWDGTAVALGAAEPGARVLLRTTSGLELRAGARLRVVDAAVSLPSDQERTTILTLGKYSELYLMT